MGNWSRSNEYGRIDPENFTPQSKNPIIARFFMNIGRADQLGSGIRNLYKYTKLYSDGEPELIEGDVYKTIIPLVSAGEKQANKTSGKNKRNNRLENIALNEFRFAAGVEFRVLVKITDAGAELVGTPDVHEKLSNYRVL